MTDQVISIILPGCDEQLAGKGRKAQKKRAGHARLQHLSSMSGPVSSAVGTSDDWKTEKLFVDDGQVWMNLDCRLTKPGRAQTG